MQMGAGWRGDLMVNSSRTGRKGAIQAWIRNPGFAVVTLARAMQRWHARGTPLGKVISALIWWHIVRRYGCYISPAARFGSALRLPHPVGIVIGDDVRLGDNVTLYQHVTLGRRNAALASYPMVGDGVTVYAGAVLVGPITIGEGAVIGANAVVASDVAPGRIARVRSGDA
ncbi:serine acetyltransferase [Sphingomonas sp. ABOLE]|nr:serine acetyltransferase [Sphingomonas sp. ABOLE]